MSESTRPEIDPYPQSDSSADFTATATASPDAWERLGENLARIQAGFDQRDQK